MARKTIPVEILVEKANRILASTHGDPEFRHGIIAMVETALFESGQYRGYGYLSEDQVPLGERPGIVNNGTKVVSFPDPTRRRYI